MADPVSETFQWKTMILPIGLRRLRKKTTPNVNSFWRRMSNFGLQKKTPIDINENAGERKICFITFRYRKLTCSFRKNYKFTRFCGVSIREHLGQPNQNVFSGEFFFSIFFILISFPKSLESFFQIRLDFRMMMKRFQNSFVGVIQMTNFGQFQIADFFQCSNFNEIPALIRINWVILVLSSFCMERLRVYQKCVSCEEGQNDLASKHFEQRLIEMWILR